MLWHARRPSTSQPDGPERRQPRPRTSARNVSTVIRRQICLDVRTPDNTTHTHKKNRTHQKGCRHARSHQIIVIQIDSSMAFTHSHWHSQPTVRREFLRPIPSSIPVHPRAVLTFGTLRCCGSVARFDRSDVGVAHISILKFIDL